MGGSRWSETLGIVTEVALRRSWQPKMPLSPGYSVREGISTDVDDLHRLVQGLAVYEKEPVSVVQTTVESMRQDLLDGVFRFLVAETGDGTIVAFGVWFWAYSTWEGRFIYLEDLFVLEEHRGKGIGTAFLKALAAKCVKAGGKRFRWQCLDWNTDSLRFYESIGAQNQSTPDCVWLTYQLVGDKLDSFATS